MRDSVRVRRVFWTARCGCVPPSNCRRTISNLSARSIERSSPISPETNVEARPLEPCAAGGCVVPFLVEDELLLLGAVFEKMAN